eukprot:Opistho-2@22443
MSTFRELFPLHTAACEDDAATIQAIAKAGQISVDLLDDDGWMPLHYAAWYGKTAAVEVLLQLGADVNGKTRDRLSTPLHFAAGAGRPDTCLVLLANGADKTARDSEKQTPLALCVTCKENDWQAVDAILKA